MAALPIAALLGLTSVGLGASHFTVLAQETPARLVNAWATAAAIGDLAAMDGLASDQALTPGIQALGSAWHSRVEAAYERAAIAGALKAYEAHLRWDAARAEARKEYYAIPWRQRPDDPDRWLHDKASPTLSEADQALLYVDEEGDPRSYWNDVATAGIGDWRKLSWSERRPIESAGQQPRFLAEAGAWELPLAQRAVLVQLGLDQLDQADLDVLQGADLESWAAADAFIQEQGRRLLAGAYREAYAAPGLETVQVDRPPSEGRLYAPGGATIRAEGLRVSLHGVAMQREGDWTFVQIDDLPLADLAGQLQAPDGALAFARLGATGGAL